MAPAAAPSRRVALVTVTYHSAAVLPDFLASLAAQTSREWELIVVDNASTDGSVALVEAWDGPLHALERSPANIGFAAATNRGIALALAAGFDAVLLINNDTLFAPDFLARLFATPASGHELLAPAVMFADAPDRFWYAGGRFSWWRGAFQAVMLAQPPVTADSWPADFAPACCLLVSRDQLARIGLLDERFFVYWEDVDFAVRARRLGLGFRVLSHPRLLHKVSALAGGEQSPFTIRQWHRNQILFLRKHYGRVLCLAQLPLMLAKIALRPVRGVESWRIAALRARTTLAEIVR
jgi:GT2 family glycosyltransferase